MNIRNDDSHRKLSSMSSQSQINDRGGRGLRLLSIDGGGIRGLSSLIILKEILYRMQQEFGLPQVPRPCDVFDLAGGTSTGGIIVIMLFRLQMPIDDAIEAYATLARQVFSERKWFFQTGTFKASRLEAAILDIIQSRLGIEEADARDARLLTDPELPSKCLICAMPADDLRYPTLFRTWKPAEHPNYDCTILEAARATTASPSFFKGIKIGGPIKTKYIDGSLLCNNPVKYVLDQARTLFAAYPISCVVSLGTGTEKVIGLERPDAFQRIIPTKLISVLKSIAADCERTSEEVATNLSRPDRPPLYVRLNVNYGLQNVSLAEWEKMPQVQTHTQGYLQTRDVSEKVDILVNALNTCAELSPPPLQLTPSERQLFDNLKESIAISALHDSREQPIASVRIDGTRTAEIETIMGFIERDDKSKPLLVVLGPAGSGKTWLMGSIARICKERGHHAASFFFSRNKPERNTDARLVNTLTYQIGVAIPDLRRYIARAIGADSTILKRSLETQLSMLLLEPINLYLNDHPNVALPPCVFLIDALDECGTHEIQRHVISKLCEALSRDYFPCRCILSSRFDSHGLDNVFSREPIQQLVYDKVILGTASEAEMRDIRLFLVASFDQIRRGHRFASSIPEDWPSNSDLDAVVRGSGGQFIYATTVMGYIESTIHKPHNRLQHILGIQTARSDNRPFAALEDLYCSLLSSVEDLETALLFLGVELARSCPKLWIPETFSDDEEHYLKRQFGAWDADVVLAPLAPVLHCQNRCIQLHHDFFAEYLFDPTRSGQFGDQLIQRCQEWVVVQLVQFFYDGKFVYRKDVEHLIKEAKPGTEIHRAVEMGSEVVLDQPEPLPARGNFNIWPFVAKAFLVELNLPIFNHDLFRVFHQYEDHIPLSILMKLALQYGLGNFFIVLELCKTCIVLQQQGFVELDWRLLRPDHDRLSQFMKYLSEYLDNQQTETMVPPDDYASAAIRCLWYLQTPTSDIPLSLNQELAFLENFNNSSVVTSLHNDFGNLSQSALKVFPELLKQVLSPSHELLVALKNPLRCDISLESPSLFQRAENVIQVYLTQHSA